MRLHGRHPYPWDPRFSFSHWHVQWHIGDNWISQLLLPPASVSGKLLVALDLYGAIGDVSQHKAPFTDLVKNAGELFNLSVSDASTIKGNILERKTKRTTFIDALRASLKNDGFGRGWYSILYKEKYIPRCTSLCLFYFLSSELCQRKKQRQLWVTSN